MVYNFTDMATKYTGETISIITCAQSEFLICSGEEGTTFS